ncbi:MAG: metal-dependent hydrolase [Halodesulfurarchaeum sp.]
MRLTWHGHSTWAVTVEETDLLIDPFFDNPHTALTAEDIETPEYVLLTHGHADHIADVPAFSDSTVVATPELAAYVADEYGVTETIGMNLGGTVELGDAHVTMHRADHSNGIETDYTHSAGMPAGFAISDATPTPEDAAECTTFYHAGDTALMTEFREVIGPYLDPDAAAVPIGDHYTMGPAQAAVAADWLGAEQALPMHYDTFPAIEQDPEQFESAVAAESGVTEAVVLEGDQSIDL